jgi:hypothetical protein
MCGWREYLANDPRVLHPLRGDLEPAIPAGGAVPDAGEIVDAMLQPARTPPCEKNNPYEAEGWTDQHGQDQRERLLFEEGLHLLERGGTR